MALRQRITSTLLRVSTLFVLAGCIFFGDPPHHLILDNMSPETVRYLINSDGGELGSTDQTPSGVRDYPSWAECGSKWVILTRQATDEVEFYREKLDLCPGDRLTINDDFEVNVSCGDFFEGRSRDC